MRVVVRFAALILFAALPASSQSGHATVHFYGDGYFGTRHVPLYVDDSKVATLHGKEVIDVPILSGQHSIHSGDKHSGFFVDAADGGDYYVKVTLGGSFVLHGQVTLIDPAQGRYEAETRKKSAQQTKTTP